MTKQANRRRGEKPESDPARSPLLQAERAAIEKLRRKMKRNRSAADSKRKLAACRKAGKQFWASERTTRELKIGLLVQVFDVGLDKLTAAEADGLREAKQAGRRTVAGTTGAVFHDTLRDMLPEQSRDTCSLWACGLRQALIDGRTPANVGVSIEKEGITKLGRRFTETRREERAPAAAKRRGTTDAKAARAAPGKGGKQVPTDAKAGNASPRGKRAAGAAPGRPGKAASRLDIALSDKAERVRAEAERKGLPCVLLGPIKYDGEGYRIDELELSGPEAGTPKKGKAGPGRLPQPAASRQRRPSNRDVAAAVRSGKAAKTKAKSGSTAKATRPQAGRKQAASGRKGGR